MNTILNDNFGNIEPKYSDYDSSKVVVISAPYEKTTSYGQGTKNGPRAIIKASQNMEYYDEELDAQPYEIGIHTLKEINFDDVEGEAAIKKIKGVVGGVVKDNKFPVMLGGEHTITTGAVLALKEKYPDLCVVQLDAHADLRNEYEGTIYNHACVMRRVIDICPIVQLGIRAFSQEEADFIKERKLKPFYAYRMAENKNWIDKAIALMKGSIYLSFDLDFLDPSIMSSTGTPEPGGFLWYETMEFLRRLIGSHKLVGLDIVELAPVEGNSSPDFTAAKLIYKILGYQQKFGR